MAEWTLLIFDEMTLKTSLLYNPEKGRVEDFEDLGEES